MTKRRIHLTEGQLYGLVQSALSEMGYNTTKIVSNGRGMKRNIKESIKTWVDDKERPYAETKDAEEAVRFVLQHQDDEDMRWDAINGTLHFGGGWEIWASRCLANVIPSLLKSKGLSEETPLEDKDALLAIMETAIEQGGRVIFCGRPVEDEEEDYADTEMYEESIARRVTESVMRKLRRM